MKEFVTKNFIGIIVIVLLIIIYLQRCGNDASSIPVPDTTTKTNTVYIQQSPVIVPQYIPVPGNSQAPIVLPQNYQPSQNLEALIKQYNDLATRFLTINTYKDSIELKDSLGKKVGIVNLEDVVYENEIKSRKPSYQLKFPHTTTTITIKEPYKLKNQVFIGGGVLGTQNSLVKGGKVGVYLKNKKDQLYGISAHKVTNYPVIYSAELYWKIRLGKK